MLRWRCPLRAALGVAAGALTGSPPAAAGQFAPPPAAQADSITVAMGSRYHAGALHRWVYGSGYRHLWVKPVRVPVLHLDRYAGGIHPTKVGGGAQTKSLRLETVDGTEYVFRLSDKSSSTAPASLKGTPAEGIFQDAVSAMHPAAAIIAAPILEASGVLHPTAVLMVMADDSALGKFRGDFAGRLGMIEEYPNVPGDGSGFGGATKIIDSEELLRLLNGDSRQHVDARAFLAARLTDFLMNDNDRHPGNWKWARLESAPKTQWVPIARDRDHAFTSYGGWLVSLARMVQPSLVSFADEPNVRGLTETLGFDARLLSGLEKPVWDSVAHALQARITDSVIHAAARAMPLEYQASAPQLEAVLKSRRAALPDAADRFYRLLARRVQVQGSDAPERVVISRVSDSSVDVRLESGGMPGFSRRFDARETLEILVYLHGGDDTALVTGQVEQSITVRVIGGNGTNTLIDSSTVAGHRHPTRLYDAGTVGGVSYGADSMFDRRPWETMNGTLVPHRPDDGSGFQPVAGLSLHRRSGITPRVGIVRYGYGFARRPYSSMVKLEGAYAFRHQGVSVELSADQRMESSPLHFTAMAGMSQLEDLSFYGFGNATIDSGGSNGYFEVHQTRWKFHPAIAIAVGERMDISLGPVIQHSATDGARSPYLATIRPYGYGPFNQAGLQLGVRYEWRGVREDPQHAPPRALVQLEGFYFPALLDVRSPFEVAAVTLGLTIPLPVPTHPYFVVRAGGRRLFGAFPFHEAAFIGGIGTTRYMDTQRYAGDASLYGTSELRIPVAHLKILMPFSVGILGVAEAGRVYVDGRSPGGWHARAGGGVWIGRGDASSVLTIVRTTEPGHHGLHVGFGLHL